jgi:hypothetical protein
MSLTAVRMVIMMKNLKGYMLSETVMGNTVIGGGQKVKIDAADYAVGRFISNISNILYNRIFARTVRIFRLYILSYVKYYHENTNICLIVYPGCAVRYIRFVVH